MDHLMKAKERSPEKILQECRLLSSKSWKESEQITARFFERLEVSRGYQLKYHIISEIKQYLPVNGSLSAE